jgi:hypothetical protein
MRTSYACPEPASAAAPGSRAATGTLATERSRAREVSARPRRPAAGPDSLAAPAISATVASCAMGGCAARPPRNFISTIAPTTSHRTARSRLITGLTTCARESRRASRWVSGSPPGSWSAPASRIQSATVTASPVASVVAAGQECRSLRHRSSRKRATAALTSCALPPTARHFPVHSDAEKVAAGAAGRTTARLHAPVPPRSGEPRRGVRCRLPGAAR